MFVFMTACGSKGHFSPAFDACASGHFSLSDPRIGGNSDRNLFRVTTRSNLT